MTGFEILLNKCHEWEEVAHSGVSLTKFTKNITDQIISWRKLELSLWKSLLDTTLNKLNEPIYKFWIYLYEIMEQFLKDASFSNTQLIETLQNFIAQSNLAEFHKRLDLLYAFHCHCVHLEPTVKTQAFVNITWNLYNYFKQFHLDVTKKIRDFRNPIEKKLKDFVKIVRWKDINYWAIKETVDKTHKTLHKYIREFQDVLKQPVRPFLINTNTVENLGIWDIPQIPETNSELTATVTKYPVLIETFNNFVTEIIENSLRLQKLEVDITLTKEKQKAHAKSILQQKHRALADLFKLLNKLGLYFKTGLLESNIKNTDEEFLIKPVDICASFNHIKCTNNIISQNWERCETYYLKSRMRADVLNTALKSPAQDLGIQNMDRCKGFSAHLLVSQFKNSNY